MEMKLTNEQVVFYLEKLNNNFSNEKRYIPFKIGYAIQSNLIALALQNNKIEQAKEDILKEFNITNINNIDAETEQKINERLYILGKEKVDIDIKIINYEDIKDFDFTLAQIDALLFMV